MGPIEWIMNTPSHHRVHHGTNPKYLDKNFAGCYIIWDRLLGTFVEEVGVAACYIEAATVRSCLQHTLPDRAFIYIQ